MPRTRDDYDEEPEDESEFGDDYDAETDYDPDDPDTYPEGVYVHSDERSVVPCPHCRAEMDEESEQCPTCGAFISREDAPANPGSRPFAVLLIVALLAALFLAVTR